MFDSEAPADKLALSQSIDRPNHWCADITYIPCAGSCTRGGHGLVQTESFEAMAAVQQSWTLSRRRRLGHSPPMVQHRPDTSDWIDADGLVIQSR